MWAIGNGCDGSLELGFQFLGMALCLAAFLFLVEYNRSCGWGKEIFQFGGAKGKGIANRILKESMSCW